MTGAKTNIAENTKIMINITINKIANPFPLKNSLVSPLNIPTSSMMNNKEIIKAAKKGVVTLIYSTAFEEIRNTIAIQKLTKI